MTHLPGRRFLWVLAAPLLIAGLSAQQTPPAPRPPTQSPPAQPCAGGALDPTCNRIGIPPVPLQPEIILETAEQPKIRVVTLTKELMHPWGLAFLPDGSMLVTERQGRLRVLRNGKLDPTPISGVPEVRARELRRLDGRGGASAVRRNAVGVPHLHEADGRTTAGPQRSPADASTASRCRTSRRSSSRSPTPTARRGSPSARTACST